MLKSSPTFGVIPEISGLQLEWLLRAIVDSSDDAIISKDLEGTITSWNKSAERLFGYTAQEAIGQAVAKLLIPSDRQNEEPQILARLRKGERVDHFQTKRRCKDGTVLDISLTISPVRDPRDVIIGASKIARDITDQVRTQAALREANESLKRSNSDLEHFAYSASHDLQEPLRIITAYSQMVQKKFATPLGPDGIEYLGYVVDAAARMERLLADLRAYTHVTLTDTGLPPVIAAQASLERTISTFQRTVEESGARIVSAPLPSVKCAEFHLDQLFQNLIGNALRYRGAASPEIEIGAERDGDKWRFFVRDNGIGIGPEYQEEIFGIFKRLHTSSEYPGTGMGLAICKRIVERTGGKIWLESSLGTGSTFYFTLPAE